MGKFAFFVSNFNHWKKTNKKYNHHYETYF